MADNNNIEYVKLLVHRGAEADMPILAEGEPGYVLDTQTFVVGTGGKNVALASKEQLDSIENFIYSPPKVSLVLAPDISVREYGNPVLTTLTLQAITARTIHPITKVEYFQGTRLLHTADAPNPQGGNEVHSIEADLYDSTTFKAVVHDERGFLESTKTIEFVYPFYVGAINTLNPAEAIIKGLTKLVKSKSDTSHTFTLFNNHFCFAYPKSYGMLTSITDKNGFETINTYVRKEVSVTGLNGLPVVYYVYISENSTTQTDFTNNYKF